MAALPHLRDISDWQGLVDWRLEATEVVGVYCKVSQGQSWEDERSQARLRNAEYAGIKTGGYSYLTPGVGSPESQAAKLLSLAPTGSKKHLKPCLDVEVNPLGLPLPALAVWVTGAAIYVKEREGYYPVVYGSPFFLESFAIHAAPVLGACPLWVADYGVKVPKIPAPWTHAAAWQWTDVRKDPAVGTVDDSLVFDLADLTVP